MSKTASALTSATTPLAGTEIVYLVQGGNSRQGTTGSFYIPGGTDVAVVDGGTGSSTAAGARTNLGLVIGTDVQAYSANLALWSAVTPASYLTTAAAAASYQPLDSDLTSWAGVTRAAGFDTFAATPSSANLRALLSDEVGTGAAYFVGGALGTPASGTATNLTGLPLTTGVTGQLPIANGGTGQATAAAGFDALAPTTTRGDLIFRNATTNARLAAGTSGYALIAAGAGADPAWTGFVQPVGSSPSTRTWQSKESDFVSILDYGGIGDGNIANAATNATALTNALATGKKVLIPYTSAGYHFGTNTITLATGNVVEGERGVTLKTTTTTMFFSCTGYDQEWGVSNVTIDATGAGGSSTIFRFRTASGVVYRGRFDRVTVTGAAEVFGDEVTASFYSVDIRVTNLAIRNPQNRSIYLRHSRGFMWFENIQHDLTVGARAISWECGRFEDAVGLEITRWDVSGGPLITNSTVTVTIASPGVVTWTAHNLVAGDAIRLTTTGALPTGLAVATTYFVKTVLDANTFTLSATSGGAVINTSGSQSGTHTATRAPVYQPSAYGLVVSSSTSVWLNRVEVDSTWGNGYLLSSIRFLRTNQMSAFANLGNQIPCSGLTESELSDTTITGASGLVGDGGGGGLTVDSSSANVAISNIGVTNCSAVALSVNNSSKISIANYNSYSNASYPLALLGTADLVVVNGGNWSSNGFASILNTSSGTKNTIQNVAGYNPVGAAAVTTGASPYTYTASTSPETLYFSASTGISAITQNGVSILPAALAANVPYCAQLGPNEAIVVTYTGTLTAKKMIH